MACREAVDPAFFFCYILCFVMMVSAVLTADVGLRFTSSPESIIVPPGDDVVFECSLNVSVEKAQWRHRGKPLLLDPEEADLEGIGARLEGFDLVVQVSKDPERYKEQAGDYQCVASFGPLRLASKPAQLTIAEIRDFPEKRDENYTVSAGNTVALDCDPPVRKPSTILEYYHNRSGEFRQLSIPPGESTLVLSNVTEEDSGIYSCKATTFINIVVSRHRIHLQVKRRGNSNSELQAPYFLRPPRHNYTAVIGSNITLECAPVGHPPPLVKWKKYGGDLSKERAKVVPGGLQIIRVANDDLGTYLCNARNRVNASETIIQLNIEEPPTITKEPSNVVIQEGGHVEMECHAKGLPMPVITWLFNGESVENDSLIRVQGDKLKVQNVQLRHAGIVQCFATNHLDSVFGSAMLSVSPKQHTDNSSDEFPLPDLANENGFEDPLLVPTPSTSGRKHGKKKDRTRKGKGRRKDKKHKAVMVPPSQPNVTRLTDESVMVRWAVPENDGLKIQFFKVQYRDMGTGKGWNTIDDDIPPHIRSYEVRNLIINHIYRFRIAAVYTNNDNQLGRNSIRFHMQEPTTKKPPYPPTLIATQAISPSAIRIEWQYSDIDAVPIEGFIIYYRATTNAGEYTKASVEKNTRAYIITYLLPSTFYDIQIKSYNNAGASESSTVFTTRTLDSELNPTKADEGVSNSGENATTQPPFSNNDQLYMVLGTVLGGGLVLLLLLFLALYNCRQRHNALRDEPMRRSPSKYNLLLEQNIYQKEAFNKEKGDEREMKIQKSSYYNPTRSIVKILRNANPASGTRDIHDIYQTSGSDLGFNGNGIVNGHAQNGYLPQGKLNITNNPLSETDEDKNQNVMESSFIGRKSHNCPVATGIDHGSRLYKGSNEVESESASTATHPSSHRSSLDSPVIMCHRSQMNEPSTERSSSPSWKRQTQKPVLGREDYV